MSIVKTIPNDVECPECGGVVANQNGESYCQSCGLVLEENTIDYQEEWRSSTSRSDQPNRGAFKDTNKSHDKGLGSFISFSDKDAKRNQLDSSKRKELERLRKWQNAYQFSSQELRLRSGIGEIHRLASALNLTDSIVEAASKLFKQAQENDSIKGRSIDGIAGVCLFITARSFGYTRSIDEWLNYMDTRERSFRTYLSAIQEELNIGYKPSVPLDYVNEVCDKFDLTDGKRYEVRKIIKQAQDENIHVGKRPRKFVGGAIYLVDRYITQEKIAEELGCSITTIRNRYQDLIGLR